MKNLRSPSTAKYFKQLTEMKDIISDIGMEKNSQQVKSVNTKFG
jgi:hypothetical protein